MSAIPKHLLVPMHIDALVVGKDVPFLWASLAADFSKLKSENDEKPYIIGTDLRFPFTAGKKMAGKEVPKGIHLHFRLPPPLTHRGASDTNFPKVPNRWLVQRYYTDKNRHFGKAWMVFSDRESTEKDAVIVPVFRHTNADAKYTTPLWLRPTGVTLSVVEQDGDKVTVNPMPSEGDMPALIALTAVTGGDAGFAGHYPACRGILGFYDKLDGVPNGTELSYLVTGWYSGSADDPWSQFLDGLKNENETRKLEEVRKWLKEHRSKEWPGFEEEKTLPSGILCHGLVRNVRWNAAGYKLDASSAPKEFHDFFAKDPENHLVDFGNNSAEAIAARVAKERGGSLVEDKAFEDIVAAFQTGLLSQGPGVSELDAEIHRHGFAAVGGGQTWVLERETTAMDWETQAPSGPLPRDLQEKLENLNRLQVESDKLERRLGDYQWELYALWHRWTYALKEGEKDEDLAAALEVLIEFLKGYRKLPEHEEVDKNLAAAKAAVEKVILAQTSDVGTAKLSLVKQPADPFYAPNDPVMTISGPAMVALGTDQRPQAAICRVTGQEFRKFTYQESDTGSLREMEATREWLEKQVASKYLDAIPAWCQTLLREAMFRDEMQKIEKEKDAGVSKYMDVKAADGGVLPPGTCDFVWGHNPWIPMYVYWKFQWTSDYKEGELLNDQAILSRWKLNDPAGKETKYPKADLVSLGVDPDKTGKPTSYSYYGYSLLGRPLLDQRLDLAGPGTLLDQIKKVFPAHGRGRMTSQSLGGFHESLIMRQVGDQLPPFSFQKWKGPDNFLYLDDMIAGALAPGQTFDSSPATSGPFLPLRAGRFKLEELWVVDAFGQAFNLYGPQARQINICASQRLGDRSGPSSGAPPVEVQFRPRFCRPMRLAFTGAPACNPTDVAPAFSPVCGWVVANHFEKSLILYTANGRPAGALQTKFGRKPGTHLFYWVPVPGSNVIGQNYTDIRNKFLQGFAKFILELTPSEGRAFAELIDHAVSDTELRVPENSSPVSALAGRPLALVRAELRLETAGLHALDQKKSWIAEAPNQQAALRGLLNQALKESPPPELSQFMRTKGVERVLCPVRLGDGSDPADGLVGFFVDEDLSTGPFYASWGLNFGGSFTKLKGLQDLSLDAVNPLRVTLLMDPQARVHATSGVVPRVSFALPAAEAAGARQVREIFFQAAPVLGTTATPEVPKPSDDYGQWSWACRPPVTGSKLTPYSERPWHEDPELVAASDRANLEAGSITITEGWLKLKIAPVRINDLWVKEGTARPKANDKITLVWTQQGADWVQLSSFGSKQPLMTWEKSPLATEFPVTVNQDTTYELVVRDQAGYEDRRQITIQIES